MEGAAERAWSTASALPSAVLTPPIFGPMSASWAPSAVIAWPSFFSSASSTPSVISAPILRPLRVGGAFLMRLRAGRRLEIDGLARRGDLVGLALHAQRRLDGLAEVLLDDHEMAQHALADRDGLDLAELEGEGADDVALLRLRQGAEQKPRLAVMIGEALRPQPDLLAGFRRAMAGEAQGRILPRALGIQAVGLIGDPALGRLPCAYGRRAGNYAWGSAGG